MHACMPPEVQPTLITCAIRGNQGQSGATDAHHLCKVGVDVESHDDRSIDEELSLHALRILRPSDGVRT